MFRLIAIVMLFSLIVQANTNLESFNTIRVAQSSSPFQILAGYIRSDNSLGNRDWLLSKRMEGYNYLAVGLGDASITSLNALKPDLEVVISVANECGLRVIPIIFIGNGGSGWWKNVNPSIQLNRVTWSSGGTSYISEAPSYAQHSAGIDKSLDDLFQVIKDSYLAAGATYPVEYVGLAYDEFAIPWHSGNPKPMLPGGSGQLATVDKAFIESQHHTFSNQDRIHALVIGSIHRRAKRLKNYFGPRAKAIVWADVFDIEASGAFTYNSGYFTYNYNQPFNVQFPDALTSLPGLSASEKAEIKGNVILSPWSYMTYFASRNQPYNHNNAIQKLAYQLGQASFKVIYSVGIHVGDPLYKSQGIDQMKKFVSASTNYKGSVMGYWSTWWSQNLFGEISFETSNEIISKNLFPSNSFRYDHTSVVSLMAR
jgi:hypothetical protein